MNIRNLLIVLLVVILIIIFFRNRGGVYQYELNGKITMVNNCSSNTVDLSDKIRIKAWLHFPSSAPIDIEEHDIDAPVENPTTRETDYSLKITTNRTADKWKVEYIKRNDRRDICEPIRCPSPMVCRDISTSYTADIPIPSGQRTVTKDYRIDCACGAPIQPTPRPTLQPFPTPESDNF
jgi:hypothetical protein